MYAQRPNIDIDSMIDKGSGLSKPRAPTPIRKAPIKIGNKQNMINQVNQWGANQLNINTNFDDNQFQQQNIKKPLISPVRNPFKTQIDHIYGQAERNNAQPRQQRAANAFPDCANHPNKQAEFNIDIEDECFAYCNRCAAQLASQGFQVRKIEPQTVKKSNPQQAGQQIIPTSMYQGNPMYELILQFLTELTQTENQHLHNMQKLTQIDQNYSTQIQNTKYFYSELIGFVEQMRDDHIADLVEENRRHSQIADIEHDYLRENVDEINTIRKDIQENLETIVEKLDEEDLRNNLNYYKQKVQVYQHKVEEQDEFFQKVISFGNEEYQEKLTRVQDFLMDVWSTDSNSSGQEEIQQQPQPQPQSYPSNFPYNNQNYFQPQNYIGMQQQQKNPMPPQQQQNRVMIPPREMPSSNRQSNVQIPPMRQMSQVGSAQQTVGVPNLAKKPSNPQNGQADNETKSTAFRKLFEEDEEQVVMAETSPQFKKI